MVSGSRVDGGAQVLSAGVRRTIQSIKEIVGNHSDADIYVVLKETNMDPNETTQKLLNQDPFHEVKRKRERKKESAPAPNKSYATTEPRKSIDPAGVPVKNNTYFDLNARRSGYSKNAATGASREFRVVRDNRVNPISSAGSKPAQVASEMVMSSGPAMSGPAETSERQKTSVGQQSSRTRINPTLARPKQAKVFASDDNKLKQILREKHLSTSSVTSMVQVEVNSSQPYSAGSSSSSVVGGVYSSNSDPVHVPSPHSRPAANIGAIRREVGAVGLHRHSSDNFSKTLGSQSNASTNTRSGQDYRRGDPIRPIHTISKSDQASQSIAPAPEVAVPVRKSHLSNYQYGSRFHQSMSHQKASQPNKEWKPKATPKPAASSPGAFESSIKTMPLDEPHVSRKKEAPIEDSVSQLNLSEKENVTIAAHIRVSEADRGRLTFGSLGTDLGTLANPTTATTMHAVVLSADPSGSVSSGLTPDSPGDEQAGGGKSLEMMDDSLRSSGSDSPVSGVASDHQLTEKNEPSVPQDVDNYIQVSTLETLRQQEASELPSFSGYDPQVGYEMPYFRPVVDGTVRGMALPSSEEVLSTHTTSSISASSMAMAQQQQQQQQLAQMYPQLHFANLMPYRQFLSPVYGPPMPVPGYSNSTTYPHPSNGNGYVLMPGNSSHHLTASGVKYGVQQFKPVPVGGATGFGNFTSPAGYAINTPAVVAGVGGHDESSRIKYKNLYVPNPQAETSEIWMNPREVPGLQSASFYNMSGQSPHPTAYMASHSGHASFTAAQSSHMQQFPGMYHHPPPPPQPGAITGPHHLGPSIGGGAGVGVAAPGPGAQVAAAYQKPQLGHLNWTGNF